jgi:A/G-specific adenine glycosylase
MTSRAIRRSIQKRILPWYREHGRHDLPWRASRDPYRVLVSELMLQQTQVPRVIPKYNAFIAEFPTVRRLAVADRAAVLRHWQGLGYNNRAVRLHALARVVSERLDGVLPQEYDALRALPGIGPYTAGAIMSFAYDKPAPCVDVNIRRVLSRIAWRKSERPSQTAIDALALRAVTQAPSPHDWHSALMDFGSAVCTARSPKCASCQVRPLCASKGMRPDEVASREHARQPSFLGSIRWWRGQILKRVLEEPRGRAALLRSIRNRPSPAERARFAQALGALEQEGLLRKRQGRYSVEKS